MNPFLIDNYVSPIYFCDRVQETKALIDNILNKRHTAFFAQRRVGKTALIKHVFYLLERKRTTCIYLDIYATQNLKDFTNELANSIYQAFPAKKSIGKLFWEAIKLLRPVISADEVTGTPQLTLDITQPRQFERTIPQLLQFLDSQNIKVAIAIDEFQQILEYPEKNIEALLRTTMLSLKNVCFIFCGSNQRLMAELFNSAKRPFYASTDNIHIDKIASVEYHTFIQHHFVVNKYKITNEDIGLLLSVTHGHTFYTQRLCHELFANSPKKIETQHIYAALHKLLLANQHMYFQYRNLLTMSQWNLLAAVAIEGIVTQPYSQKFIYKYNLGTSAKVKRSIEALIANEMLYHNISVPQPYYEVYDKFLMLWMQQKHLR